MPPLFLCMPLQPINSIQALLYCLQVLNTSVLHTLHVCCNSIVMSRICQQHFSPKANTIVNLFRSIRLVYHRDLFDDGEKFKHLDMVCHLHPGHSPDGDVQDLSLKPTEIDKHAN